MPVSRFSAYCIGIGAGLLVLAVGDIIGWPIRWNHTASVPTGLYVRSASGDFLAFCPGEPWSKLSVERNYRPAGSVCFDGREPLLKRIVAQAGDTVVMDTKGVSINGTLPLRDSRPMAGDSEQLTLEHFPFGSYTLQPGQYWVMGDHPRSFDSRYFGPIDTSQIHVRLRHF